MQVDVPKGRQYIKKLLSQAAEFFGKELLPKNLLKNISVEIVLVNDEKTLGVCYADDWWKGRPRLFVIEISKQMKTFYLLKTLAHEFVHLKQYAMGELFFQDEPEPGVLWENKFYPQAEIDKPYGIYWDLPWEIEAFGKEEGLVIKFAEKYKHTKKSWYKNRYFK